MIQTRVKINIYANKPTELISFYP